MIVFEIIVDMLLLDRRVLDFCKQHYFPVVFVVAYL